MKKKTKSRGNDKSKNKYSLSYQDMKDRYGLVGYQIREILRSKGFIEGGRAINPTELAVDKEIVKRGNRNNWVWFSPYMDKVFGSIECHEI